MNVVGGVTTSLSDPEVLQLLVNLSKCGEEQQQQQQEDDDDDDAVVKRLCQNVHVQSCLSPFHQSNVVADTIFRILTPYLFGSRRRSSPDHQDEDTTNRLLSNNINNNSLLVLTLLVVSSSSKFLKTASRAVADFTSKVITSQTTTTSNSITVSDELAQLLTSQLVGTDVEVTCHASQSIVSLCSCKNYYSSNNHNTTMAGLFVPRIYYVWCHHHHQNNHQDSSVIQVRCATTIVLLATLSNEAFDVFVSSGSAQLLLDMLQNCGGDPLLQISIMDLMEQLVMVNDEDDDDDVSNHQHRISWCLSPPVLTILLNLANDADCLFQGPALVLVASLCHLLPLRRSSRVNEEPQDYLLQPLRSALLLFHDTNVNGTTEELPKLQFINAVSSLASSGPRALEMVLRNDHDNDHNDLRTLWLALPSSQAKLKAVLLTSVSRCMRIMYQQQQQQDSSSSSLCEALYQAVGEVNRPNQQQHHENNTTTTTSKLLLSLATSSPVAELRIAAYGLLRALVDTTTEGAMSLLQQQQSSSASVLELWLQDQHFLETNKEAKEAKYEVMQAISNKIRTQSLEPLLPSEVTKRIQQILSNGAYHVPAKRWDVMVDE